MAGTEDVTAVDTYGRRTVFRGELLFSDTTDTADRHKPQWMDIDVWRTEGGSFVVKKDVQYRVVHARRSCPRLVGHTPVDPDEEDTVGCQSCSPEGPPSSGGWAQESRVTVDAYRTPEELIESLKVRGEYTRLSRTLLADLAEQDDRIDRLWNTVVID